MNPLLDIMFGFISLLVVILIVIMVMGILRSKKSRDEKSWESGIALLVSMAIFSDDQPEEFNELLARNRKLLLKPGFRQSLINGLTLARKELAGTATVPLIQFYESQGLDRDSYKKLKSKKWHVNAKGVQELAIMEQKKFVKDIFKLTNHPNESVRNEAQSALVGFYGFAGLRFLNVTQYVISDWQQIQLLDRLEKTMPQNVQKLEKWLGSTNPSVRIFSLKLAALYNCYGLYDQIMEIFLSGSLEEKIEALTYLRRYPREDTASKIAGMYGSEVPSFKLATLHALEEIGTPKEVPFLLKRLHDHDDGLKLASARALAHIHPRGVSFLRGHLFADENPWKSIFLQIENERAA
ncbi:MAG: HEAT repeat domain-containing protein [Bacteroidota bacterium]|nr:HEAT repeat domain-containing protein [Bacteroidota bacterium]